MASPGQTKDAPGHDVNADRHTFLVRLGVAETPPRCARPKAVPSRGVAPTLAPDRSEPSMHDRSASRRIRRRTVVGALGLLMVVALGTLTRVLADPAAEQIGDRRLPAEVSDVVISVAGKERDDARYLPYKRDRDSEEKLLDRFRDANDPLQMLIVTAKLLTGFDAPILQAL